MDIKTMNLKFGDEQAEMRSTLDEMAEFVVMFERAETRMKQWREDVNSTIERNQRVIEDQMQDVRDIAEELRQTLNKAGIARFRVAAEEVLQQGKEHIETLDQLGRDHIRRLDSSNDGFKTTVNKSLGRLDRASAYAIKNISEAIASFRLSDFERLTEQSCTRVEKTSTSAITRFKELTGWFHWKNLGLSFGLALVVSVSMGLYLNDELPWEKHREVAMQRNAGQALISAWPRLSQNEQKHIIENSNKAFI